MSIAAAPEYLGNDFSDASPGLRFGLLLPIWTNRDDQEGDVRQRAAAKSREGDEIKALLRQGMDHAIAQLRQREQRRLPGLWEKNDFASRDAWKRVAALNKQDIERMRALAQRQHAVAHQLPELLSLEAQSVAPFTTGLGNEHPLENGFAFLNPYGLPYLPGSGVKGVLRQAARELASGDWGGKAGWDRTVRSEALAKLKLPELSVLDLLFGLESEDRGRDHLRGVLSFWDVFPQIAGDSLLVDVMTPHQSHYYQWRNDRQGNPIPVAPHDSGQPNPIYFLTVPPGSGFAFHVVCDTRRLRQLAPGLLEPESDGKPPHWQVLLRAAFEHAFEWLGFGAKTAVGYGAMARDSKAEARREAERQERQAEERKRAEAAERAAQLAAMSPVDRRIAEAIAAKQPGQSDDSAVFNALKGGSFDASELREAAAKLKAMMQSARSWKETTAAKKPDKDKEHQRTLQVMQWLKD